MEESAGPRVLPIEGRQAIVKLVGHGVVVAGIVAGDGENLREREVSIVRCMLWYVLLTFSSIPNSFSTWQNASARFAPVCA